MQQFNLGVTNDNNENYSKAIEVSLRKVVVSGLSGNLCGSRELCMPVQPNCRAHVY